MNEKQIKDLARCRELFPEMTEQEFLDLKIWLYSWDNDDGYLRDRIIRAQATRYRSINLETFDCSSHNIGRCYNRGTDNWRRRDGQPLTPEDIQAVRLCCKGQGNNFVESEDGLSIAHNWVCDSSD
jgi:hypothetical protein